MTRKTRRPSRLEPKDYDMEIYVGGIRYKANHLGKNGSVELAEVFVGKGNSDNHLPGWRLAHRKTTGFGDWRWAE